MTELKNQPITEAELNAKIEEEFMLIGLNPKLKGYGYLVEAVKLNFARKQTGLSALVAEKFGKSSPSVERAMQNAINSAWENTGLKTLSQHYTAPVNPKKGMPTISEFIAFYSDKLKNDFSER